MVLICPLAGGELQHKFLQTVAILDRHGWKFDTEWISIVPTYSGANNDQGWFSIIQSKNNRRRAANGKDRAKDAATFFREVKELAISLRTTRFVLAPIRYRKVKGDSLGFSRVQLCTGKIFGFSRTHDHLSIPPWEKWATVIFLVPYV
jgi:hypothetical protein